VGEVSVKFHPNPFCILHMQCRINSTHCQSTLGKGIDVQMETMFRRQVLEMPAEVDELEVAVSYRGPM